MILFLLDQIQHPLVVDVFCSYLSLITYDPFIFILFSDFINRYEIFNTPYSWIWCCLLFQWRLVRTFDTYVGAIMHAASFSRNKYIKPPSAFSISVPRCMPSCHYPHANPWSRSLYWISMTCTEHSDWIR